MMFKDTISRLIDRKDLTSTEATAIMNDIMEGKATQAQIAGFLIALRMKGETAEELAAFARVMREHAINVKPQTQKMLVDTCGTGGDGMQTFNISTASAFVAAGAGVPVVKHGNRGVSNRCGSADVLAELGVSLTMRPEEQTQLIERIGIVFLFAPNHHPAMKHAMGVRQEIGCRTVFNILGPLANPAGAQAQLLGVYTPELTRTMSEVLLLMGLSRAMVVHGSGLDEITTTGSTLVSELDQGTIRQYTIHPEMFGITPARQDDIIGGSPTDNARIIREVLDGEPGAPRDIVLMNAGAAIYLGEGADNMNEGILRAKASIDSGDAMAKLDMLIEATRNAA